MFRRPLSVSDASQLTSKKPGNHDGVTSDSRRVVEFDIRLETLPEMKSQVQDKKPALPPKPKAMSSTSTTITKTAHDTRRTRSESDQSNLEHMRTDDQPLPTNLTSQTTDPDLLQKLEELQTQVIELKGANESASEEIKALQTEQSSTTSKLEHIMKQQEAMLGEIRQLKKELFRVSHSSQSQSKVYSKEEEMRREELSRLDCEQV